MVMTKTYHTVNGRILGETAAGVRTDYLTDALGSVTATVNASGAVVNRYRYKPYGALLSKTGVGADPKQQWVGSLGYRQTGKKYSDVYVRARHYDTANGRWTTKDPIGFAGADLNLYRYVKNQLPNAVDPSGEEMYECPCSVDKTTGCIFCDKRNKATGPKDCDACCYTFRPSLANLYSQITARVNGNACFAALPPNTRTTLAKVLTCISRAEAQGWEKCATYPGGELLYGLFQLDAAQFSTCGGTGLYCDANANIDAAFNMVVAGCKCYENLNTALFNDFGVYQKNVNDLQDCLSSLGITGTGYRTTLAGIKCAGCAVIKGCPKGGYDPKKCAKYK